MTPIELITQSLFTGVGTASGLYVFERFLKPHIDIGHNKFKEIKNSVLNGKLINEK